MTATDGNGVVGEVWVPSRPCGDCAPEHLPAGSVEESEITALVRAYSAGNAVLVEEKQALASASAAVVRTFRQVQDAADRIRVFAGVGEVVEAGDARRAVVARHAADGPEDRRRVVRWARRLLWPAVVLSGLYDAVYLGDILQRLTSADEGSFEYWAAYLPAVGLTLALLVAGALVAQALVRARGRAERATTRDALGVRLVLRRLVTWRDAGRREHDDLPWPVWPLAVLFTVAVFTVLGSWAAIRAKMSGAEFAALKPYEPYAALLILLSAAAVVMLKVLGHNPFADEAATVAKDFAAVRDRAEALVARARELTVAHWQAWLDLEARWETARSRACRVVELAIVELRERRSASGAASPLQPPGLAVTDSVPELLVGTHAGVVHLRLDFSVLDQVGVVAGTYSPEAAEQRVEERVAELLGQFGDPTRRAG
ncbi:hypothetical protein [Saccharothrix australiensis]|uniref:Uncharacterized protein n=1 Tax=Saccharothrix australiensis TaxID=2072 RepID=A0A495VXV5_9PSEU|nr:hypothetical protein [Saccharothrix australiensis]RKT54261.1 hypothetical protein C8E97_2877 [Saccharothrix australiensis]